MISRVRYVAVLSLGLRSVVAPMELPNLLLIHRAVFHWESLADGRWRFRDGDSLEFRGENVGPFACRAVQSGSWRILAAIDWAPDGFWATVGDWTLNR